MYDVASLYETVCPCNVCFVNNFNFLVVLVNNTFLRFVVFVISVKCLSFIVSIQLIAYSTVLMRAPCCISGVLPTLCACFRLFVVTFCSCLVLDLGIEGQVSLIFVFISVNSCFSFV